MAAVQGADETRTIFAEDDSTATSRSDASRERRKNRGGHRNVGRTAAVAMT